MWHWGEVLRNLWGVSGRSKEGRGRFLKRARVMLGRPWAPEPWGRGFGAEVLYNNRREEKSMDLGRRSRVASTYVQKLATDHVAHCFI